MKGEIELYDISFLILKVELHFDVWHSVCHLYSNLFGSFW